MIESHRRPIETRGAALNPTPTRARHSRAPRRARYPGAGASGSSRRSASAGENPSSAILFFAACAGTPMRTILKYSEYRGSSLIFAPPSSGGADKGADEGADKGADAIRSTSDASARSSSGFVAVGGVVGVVASRASVGGGALISVSLVDGAASNPSTLREKTRSATGRVGQSRVGSSDGGRRLSPTRRDAGRDESRARRMARRAPRGGAGYARGVARTRLLIFASRILSVMSTDSILLRERGSGRMR